MASTFPSIAPTRESLVTGLMRRDRSIASPAVDALLFWGAPMLAFALIVLLGRVAAALPPHAGDMMTRATVALMAILTYAHLIAVAPRAYLNREVFAAHRARLTIMPVVLVGAMIVSPAALVCGLVVAFLWDVHHSAMQTFGLGRIYDMKAGNDPRALRRVDLWLNAALYIGPIAAGASMLAHVRTFDRFDAIGWHSLAQAPVLAEAAATPIRGVAIACWLVAVAGAVGAYARAARRGYRMSAHKQALLLSTAAASILAWGFAPPLIAFMAVNLFHAIQYLALVWLKEGGRMRGAAPWLGRWTLPVFLAICLSFGALYWLVHAEQPLAVGAWLAPFVACSLLHFWYDAFVWSVRRKLV